jgi:hypothetical protein
MPAAIPAPPAAPPASGSVAPPSGGEIHVTPAPTGTEGNPGLTQPKEGSAKAKMFSEMRKKAGVPDPAPAKPKGAAAAPVPEPPRPGAEPNPAPEPAAPEPEPAPGEPPAPGAPAAAAAPADPKGKQSPWKLVDQFKARAVAAEARALELEKNAMPEAKRKETEERLTTYEKRVKEMEDDLRYFNAEKYDPEILKANADYERAWKRAVSELSEISVIDGATREPRAVTSQDIFELVNMPLGKAREVAVAAFGDFADDVMAHRKEIKNLFESKMTKLEEIKKTGAEREQKAKEHYTKMHDELTGQIKGTWERESAAVLADEKVGKFFKSREGDADWNTKLENGYKFVDEALSGNPNDPKLTPDQRSLIIRRHVAVSKRAAAFSAVRLDLERTQAKLAAAEKELEGYKASTPGINGTLPGSTAPKTGSARESLFAAIRAKAK